MKVNKNIFTNFPNPGELLSWHKKQPQEPIPEINAHIHSPNSFSSFSNIKQAFQIAKEESVSVLGINDFYSTDTYDEFAELAQNYNIFPLFNIEFMALQSDLQKSGIRVNDSNNPGRTYLCGKGLRQPVSMSNASFKKIKNLQKESNHHSYKMVEKLNTFFAERNIDIQLNSKEIQSQLTKKLFRERHIARALRLAVFEKERTEDGRKNLFRKIFSGKEVKSPLLDIAGLEDEIRNYMLKAGGAASVQENQKAFLPLEEVKEIIIDAGGIPCYPFLLDFEEDRFTEYETDKEKLLNELIKNNVSAIEFIATRNEYQILKDYVSYFDRQGFIITFGSEHNTPKLVPLKITCKGGVELDNELKNINYKGAAVIAAHQYLLANGKEGYLYGQKAKQNEREYFIELGKAVIEKFHTIYF